jgi:transposase
MAYFLSDSERAALRVQHKHERDKRICDRIKAVLLFDKGWSYAEIASVLLLDDQTIFNHVQEYKTLSKLTCNHKGSDGKLNAFQIRILLEHLDQHTYLHVKDIVVFVQATYGITYTVLGMTHWLHNHGFSYKKPAIVPGKANREIQQKWIQEYVQLKNSLQPGETICFLDGVHPTHNTKSSYGWIRKGILKHIRTNTGRYRLNLSGAIDIFSKQIVLQEDITLDTVSTLNFLEKLELAYPQATKVHIFCDNARYYKNKYVQTFLASSKLQMHFLPSYSPNLNPIERLWKFMNENILYNKYYEKFSEFREAVLGFLQGLNTSVGDIRKALERRVTDNFCPVGGGIG